MEKPKHRRLSLDRIHQTAQPEFGNRERVREDAFRSIIFNELIDNFENNLIDADFSEEEIRDIEAAVAKLNFEDASRVFCTPHETAERKFRLLRERVDRGEIAARDIPNVLIEEAERYGFGIGYHNSATEIKPDKENRWFIKPTERDHRDGDLTRAYFATSYDTLYRKGTPRFLYVVRTIAENTKTDGNWSRSNGMSIIASVPIDRVDGWVERAVKGETEKQNAARNRAA